MSTRIFVHPKDLENITGKSDRYCRKLVKTAKDAHKLARKDLLPLSTLCKYLSWDETEVRQRLK